MNKPVNIAVVDAGAGAHHGFTAAEFAHMADVGAFDGMSIELVSGVLSRTAPANLDHGRRQFDLAKALDRVISADLIVAVETALEVDAATMRAIDIALVRSHAAVDRPLTANDVLLAAEIASSTLHRDLGDKLNDYARAGIPNYWVVDPRARAVHVMSDPSEATYGSCTIVRFGEPLAVPGTDRTIVID